MGRGRTKHQGHHDPRAYYDSARKALKAIGALRQGVRTVAHASVDDGLSSKLAHIGMCIELERFLFSVLDRADKDFQAVATDNKEVWSQGKTRWLQSRWSTVRAFSLNPQNTSLGWLWSKVSEFPEVRDHKSLIKRVRTIIENRNAIAHSGKYAEEQSPQDVYDILREVIIAFEPVLETAT